MLTLVRDELRSEIRSNVRNLESKMESRFAEVKTDLIKVQLLVEEQNSNNRIVLEGLQALWQRQDRIERRFP